MKTVARYVVDEIERYFFLQRLARQKIAVPTEGLFPWYGQPPGSGSDMVHGGAIKLLHLAERFPQDSRKCNLLYLVSSAQPKFARELVNWARRRGIRFVWNQNGVAYPAWAGPDRETTNMPMRELRACADYVIYQSEFCRLSADRFLGPCRVDSAVVYNCVDTGVFRPLESRPPDTPWVLLAAGTHQQAQRVHCVLNTVALLREARHEVRLILDGKLDWPDAVSEIREAIRRLDLANDIDWLESYRQADTPDLFRQAHVLIHPKYKDPCPTVPIEAMASGVPVAGSRSGGMPELIGSDGGILVDVPDSWERMHTPDPESMVTAVENIMAQHEDWRNAARRRAVDHFDKAAWLARHEEVFNSVLGAHA